MSRPDDLRTIATTLRFVASWLVPPTDEQDERGHYDQVGHLVRAAETLETGDPSGLDACCPLCEETECDEGCPVEPHRRAYLEDRP